MQGLEQLTGLTSLVLAVNTPLGSVPDWLQSMGGLRRLALLEMDEKQDIGQIEEEVGLNTLYCFCSESTTRCAVGSVCVIGS